MGQKIGKAAFEPAAKPFINLRKAALYKLWEAFNDVADGFGLTRTEFKEIMECLELELMLSQKEMAELAFAFFELLDTDKNELVDAMEFLGTLAVCSSMDIPDKVSFTFGCYDFDESDALTIDEMTLSLKSTVTGLCKISRAGIAPLEVEVERLSQEAFLSNGLNKLDKIHKAKFIEFCLKTPEISSWVKYFDDSDTDFIATFEDTADGDIARETEGVPRDPGVVIMMDQSRQARQMTQYVREQNNQEDDFDQKQWQQIIVEPSEMPKIAKGLPVDNLLLNWVYGFRCHDVRNCLRYNSESQIIFYAGNTAVRYSTEEHEQRFFTDHTDSIVSIAMHPILDICATGSNGPEPEIIVWNTLTMQTLAVLRGFHVNAVTHLAFSPDGEHLLSIGGDDNHSVAVYRWSKGLKVFSEFSDSRKVLGCCFKSKYAFVTCGVNHIYFWQRDQSGAYVKKSGKFGRLGLAQPILCVGATDAELVISGSASGHLYLWQGRNLRFKQFAHEGPVTALYVYESSIISGGKDGKIRLYNVSGLQIEPGMEFDFGAVGPRDAHIRSVSCCPLRKRLLVGSVDSEMYELSMKDGANVHRSAALKGHCRGELRGLAMHPERKEFVTVGDDCKLIIWDAVTHTVIKQCTTKHKARAVAYAPDGLSIAVGLGCGEKSVYEGMLQVFNEEDLTVLYEARDTKKQVTDLKYDPTGRMLALASADKCVYIYNASDGDYGAKAKCKGHKSVVTHLDFDEFGRRLQTSDANHTHLYWDTDTGEIENSIAALRDVPWDTYTLPYGWGQQGIWPTVPDGTALHTLARSSSKRFMATGDNFGRIRLFNCPAIDKNSPFKEYRGHSADVRCVRFSFDDSFLCSVGGDDHAIFQWSHRVSDVDSSRIEDPEELDSEDEETFYTGESVLRTALEEAARNDDFTLKFQVAESRQSASKFKVVAPWRGSCVAPTRPPPQDNRRPQDVVALEWVNGCSAKNMRQAVKYSKSNEIIYAAACVGVVLDKYKRNQRHYTQHTDTISALALHPDQTTVATGQLGEVPVVYVWDSGTLKTLRALQGFQRVGIAHLAFNRAGDLLATIGLDSHHQIGIYDWRSNVLKIAMVCGPERPLDLQFQANDQGFVVCGMDFIRFYTMDGRNVATDDALFMEGDPRQPFLSIACFDGDKSVVGAHDGHLYVFEGCNQVDKIQAHAASVNCVVAVDKVGFCSGGKDGFVKIWDLEFECTHDHDVAGLESSFGPSVRSLVWNHLEGSLLVGTRGCEVYELSAEDGNDLNGRPVVCGHSAYGLWGLAVHPSRLEYATCGDDETIRLWDIGSKMMTQSTKLDCIMRAICYNPDGRRLAVGMGGNIGKGKQRRAGAFVVLDADTLEVLHEGKDSKHWITDIKYTPDGGTLALASQDDKVYLYDVMNGYLCRGAFEKHNSFVTHIDFSKDSQYVRSNCGALELYFSDASNGMHLPRASVLKDVEWATVSCPLCWEAQGLHAPEALGQEVAACSRSHSENLLASVDNFGVLRVYRYPCLDHDAGSREFKAHSLGARNVRFAFADQYVVTCGGEDRIVMQWRVQMDPDDEAANVAGPSGEDSQLEEEGAAEDGLAEFVAVKPWLGTIVPPTNPPKPTKDAPEVSLELECVHGYRAQDARNNARYNYKGEVVYTTAALGIVYNKEHHRQRFFSRHEGDIVALALHPTGQYVATADRGPRPRIWIWDATSGNAITSFGNFHRGSIPVLSFSSGDGSRLVSVGRDENHTIAVYHTLTGNWDDGRLQAYAQAGKQDVLFACFVAGGGEFELLTGGVHAVTFWKTVGGGTLEATRAYFGRRGKVQTLTCACSIRQLLVTGTVSGHLYTWDQEKRTILQSIKAHASTVNAIVARTTLKGDFFVTGGRDGVIKLWNTSMHCIKAFNMTEARPPPRNPSVRSVSINDVGNTILVGTQGSELFEITNIQATADITGATLLQRGHFAYELWGLAPHPTDPDIFATVGDDCTLRIWSAEHRRPNHEMAIETMSRAVAWAPSGDFLALGLGGHTRKGRSNKDGSFLIINASSMLVEHEGRDSREWITDAKYSPDGKMLALASNDNIIYLYNAEDGYPLVAKCEKHSASVRHLDFALSGAYLQSNCTAFELLYFNTSDGVVIFNPSNLKDEQWATWTCPLGWPVQGVWAEVSDGSADANCVHKAHSHDVLAVGEEGGAIKLYKYPALAKRAATVDGYGYASAVSNVRFLCDDQRLVTISRDSRTICQWRVVWPAEPEEVDNSSDEEEEDNEASRGGGGGKK